MSSTSTATLTTTPQSLGRINNLKPTPNTTPAPTGTFQYLNPNAPPENPRADPIQVSLPLHNIRTAPDKFTGGLALDKEALTVVTHRSVLSRDDWSSEATVRNVYFPETIDLVKHVTGAQAVEITRCIFRKQPPITIDMLNVQLNIAKKDSIADGTRITGLHSADLSYFPLRPVHTDYTLRGLHLAIHDAEEPYSPHRAAVIAASDKAKTSDTPYTGPRFQSFSIWRPLRTIQRDPLAIAECGTVAPEDFRINTLKGPKTTSHELIERESNGIVASERTQEQRWWYVEGQTPEEVLFIKLCDSLAETDKSVAVGVVHGSPVVEGLPDFVPPRESVEIRCTAFY